MQSFDFTTATAAISLLPTTLQNDLPSFAVFTVISMIESAVHGWALKEGYTGNAPYAFINGAFDTIRFDYRYGLGNKPANL